MEENSNSPTTQSLRLIKGGNNLYQTQKILDSDIIYTYMIKDGPPWTWYVRASVKYQDAKFHTKCQNQWGPQMTLGMLITLAKKSGIVIMWAA